MTSVLVVDTDEDALKAAGEMLDRAGISTALASTGLHALSLIRRLPVDVPERRDHPSPIAAGPGGRNSALNRASFRLHQLVAGGEIDRSECEDRLIAACRSNGLVADDGLPSVVATLRSGARAGLRHPRSRGVA